jgi:hypothetical protein
MIRSIRFDKRSKNKVSKGLKSNLAMHPFVIVSIAAALTVMVWVAIFYLFGLFSGH